MTELRSNLVLGAMLLVTGAAVLAGGYAAGLRDFASAEYFPALIAVCMLAAGVIIIAAGWYLRDVPPFRWTWLALFIAFVLAFAIFVALALYFSQNLLLFGPSEYAGTILFALATMVSLARRAHLRALGMVLLGLLVSTAGIDIVTGRLRFTFGLEAFFDGMDILVVAPAILIIGEAMLCFYSPQLWFSTFSRWLNPKFAIGPRWPMLLRVLCVAAIAASLWLAWRVHHNPVDIALALGFGIFGAICMLFGWNRIVFCLVLFYGTQLEQSLRQSLYIARGNYSAFLDRPYSLLHIVLAAAVLAAAFGLWLWHVREVRWATPAPPA